MNYQPYYVTSYTSGLQKNKKPFLLMEDAFQVLDNAYIWRERVKRREGRKLLGRCTVVVSSGSIGMSTAGTWSFNLYTVSSVTKDTNGEIKAGSVSIVINARTFTDSGKNGILIADADTDNNYGYINYITGAVVITHTQGAVASTGEYQYFPNKPIMGIDLKEESAVNVESTGIFDTNYYYEYDSTIGSFKKTGTSTWSGGDDDFFWMANYRGSNAYQRAFFATNNTNPNSDSNNRIRYTLDGITWTDLAPLVDSTNYMWMSKLIVPYYGRLLALNTIEGDTTGNAENYYARCRFSQIGDPTDTDPDAWRSDIFGKGGFIDAPTSESIVSCRFYKNTLIVFFDRSTWNLRYVGDYGLPFIWERISSDFGSESTFSTVLFDEGVLAVGDKAIVASSGNDVQRIDLMIPNEVFGFQNSNSGPARVQGGREFQKELVYWSYVEGGSKLTYPNKVLVFNYRDRSFAIFDDVITSLGTFQLAESVTWDSSTEWDSNTSWDTIFNEDMPVLISGNHQGFIHYFQYTFDTVTTSNYFIPFREQESLYVKGITLSTTDPILINSPKYNLPNGTLIYIANLSFVDTSSTPYASEATSLNNKFYKVKAIDGDENNFYLDYYNSETNSYEETTYSNLSYTPDPNNINISYLGGGVLAVLPNMSIITKDLNPYANKGVKIKSAYVDLMTDMTPNGMASINMYVNSNIGTSINVSLYNSNFLETAGQVGFITNGTTTNPCVITSENHGLQTGRSLFCGDVLGLETGGISGINNLSTSITVMNPNQIQLDDIDASGLSNYESGGYWQTDDRNFYYTIGSQYDWHRVYGNVFGSYLTYEITYSEFLQNNPVTQNTDFELNAMTFYFKPAGKLL